jgi:hypothetical protein
MRKIKGEEISILFNDKLIDIDHILKFYFKKKISKSKFYRLVRENKFPKPITKGYFACLDGWVFFVETNNKSHKSYWSKYDLYCSLRNPITDELNGMELNYGNLMTPPSY